jgi:hypothetical protein
MSSVPSPDPDARCFRCQEPAGPHKRLLERPEGDLACPDCLRAAWEERARPFEAWVGGPGWTRKFGGEPAPPRPPADEGEPDQRSYHVLYASTIRGRSYYRDELLPPGTLHAGEAGWLRGQRLIAPVWEGTAPAAGGAPAETQPRVQPPSEPATRAKARDRGPDNDIAQLQAVLHDIYRGWLNDEADGQPCDLSYVVAALQERGYAKVSRRTLQRYQQDHGLKLPPFPEDTDG